MVSSKQMVWLKFSLANLFRNGRRSFYTILAIAIGYAAINVFGGFTSYIFTNLKDSFIYSQANGHLTVFKEGFLTEGRLDPTKYLISHDEYARIENICKNIPEIVILSPQLSIMGLISNGEVSSIFVGKGKIPSRVKFIQKKATGMIGNLQLFKGKALEDEVMFGVGLTNGLSDKLGLDIGSNGIAMASTVDGRVNALDLEIFLRYDVPVEELNDKVMAVPLQFAQALYDTKSIDGMTILLNKDSNVPIVKEELQAKFKENTLNLEIKTWQELSHFYRKVKDMFNIIFIFIFIIVFTIVVTSIINTLSMSVMERTQEIGTLRALGLKRKGIIGLFALESAMLGIAGSFTGILISIASWMLIKLLEPEWMPPNYVIKIPLEISLVPAYLAWTLIFLVVLSTIVSVIPARKAAHKSIVDALGHV